MVMDFDSDIGVWSSFSSN